MDDSGRKWGIIMFMGEYHHSIDEKNRLIMPSKFRYDLGETFVVTRGIDSCLFVYPKETWNKLHLQIIFYGREYSPARGNQERDYITRMLFEG